MSSIVEGYITANAKPPQKVIKTQIERDAEAVPPEEIDPAEALITSAVDELEHSLGDRCKRHDIDGNTLIIQTGKEDTPPIEVEVKGYAAQEGVVTAGTQEDSTKIDETLPPVDNIPDYPTEDTDQVASVRKYNTDQYMKHSELNPKKFG